MTAHVSHSNVAIGNKEAVVQTVSSNSETASVLDFQEAIGLLKSKLIDYLKSSELTIDEIGKASKIIGELQKASERYVVQSSLTPDEREKKLLEMVERVLELSEDLAGRVSAHYPAMNICD